MRSFGHLRNNCIFLMWKLSKICVKYEKFLLVYMSSWNIMLSICSQRSKCFAENESKSGINSQLMTVNTYSRSSNFYGRDLIGDVEINDFAGKLKLKWERKIALRLIRCLSTCRVIISRSKLIHRAKLFSCLKTTLQMVTVSRSW